VGWTEDRSTGQEPARGQGTEQAENSPRRPVFVESPTMLILLALALAYTMYFAAFMLMPIAFAFVLGIILIPVVRFLRNKMFIPHWIGAMIVLVGLIALPGAGLYGLAHPTAGWFAAGFEGIDRAEARLEEFLEPLRQVRVATERVAEIATIPDGDAPVVRVRDRGIAGTIMDWTQGFVVTAAIILVLLYFMMATDGLFTRRLISSLPTWRDKRTAHEIAEQIQNDVSHYLLTITVINALLGVVVAMVMWMLGMPSPVLWGVLAALLNYIPYVGALVGVGLAGIIALVTFDSIPYAILVAAIYYGLTGLEGSFIVPAVLGRRLYLNPVVVFVGLVYWGWVWGIPGALLAVPMLSIMKIVADKIKPLNPIGEVLGK
jgi:predicted PurR-regulated permease PerM